MPQYPDAASLILGAATYAEPTAAVPGTTEFTLGAPAQATLLTAGQFSGSAKVALGGPLAVADGSYVAASVPGFAVGGPAAPALTMELDGTTICNLVRLTLPNGDAVETDGGAAVWGLLQAAAGVVDASPVGANPNENVQLSFISPDKTSPVIPWVLVTLPAGTYRFAPVAHRRLTTLHYAQPLIWPPPVVIPRGRPRFVNVVYVDGTYGSDTRPQPAGYKTITAALAATANTVAVDVAPGTYAENITLGGSRLLHLRGATIGTGGGPAVTVAGGGTPTVAGAGFLAKSPSVVIPVGAYLVLAPTVVLEGTISGVCRVGEQWVLGPGCARDTYIPPNGAVIALTDGDLLHQIDAGVWRRKTTAAVGTAGAALDWIGADAQADHGYGGPSLFATAGDLRGGATVGGWKPNGAFASYEVLALAGGKLTATLLAPPGPALWSVVELQRMTPLRGFSGLGALAQLVQHTIRTLVGFDASHTTYVDVGLRDAAYPWTTEYTLASIWHTGGGNGVSALASKCLSAAAVMISNNLPAGYIGGVGVKQVTAYTPNMLACNQQVVLPGAPPTATNIATGNLVGRGLVLNSSNVELLIRIGVYTGGQIDLDLDLVEFEHVGRFN